ncbi:glycosyltransferase family 2 protein [Nodosilinea sp. E11]|uniref:glycosyltransferase family 2 protein n=1 Tax=Nodosilinea sp. E11 TaxID=3037479 RepID=UPI0029343879|nr:glycosyltransferase family 2 protein [Nodosilinea sp. E11]WOD40416.1 glycosyltransferase family 2 protein [Nodosilinea sp. E11]
MGAEQPSPKVALVVPTHNRKAKTLRFLTQIADQTYGALQVIVVDAGSRDGTPEAVNQQFPLTVVLPVNAQNFWAGATNAGVSYALKAGCDYVLTINDDAVVQPDHVERLVNLAEHLRIRILGNQINYLADRDRIWSLGTYTAWGTQDFLRLAHSDASQRDLAPEVAEATVITVDALPGNGVLIHHSVYRQIGLYNAIFLPHYHADSELVMRAVGQGISAYVTPQVVLYNDFSAAQKQLSLGSVRGLAYALGHKKSHLYLPALLYIFCRYCPLRQKGRTLKALGQRFGQMRR